MEPKKTCSFGNTEIERSQEFHGSSTFYFTLNGKNKDFQCPQPSRTQTIPLESEFRQKQHKYYLQNNPFTKCTQIVLHHHSRSSQQSSGPNMQFSYCTSPGLVSMHLLIYNLQETCQSKPVSKAKAHYAHLQADISHPSLFSMYSANIYVFFNTLF